MLTGRSAPIAVLMLIAVLPWVPGAGQSESSPSPTAATTAAMDATALEAEMQAVLAELGLPVFDRVVYAVDFGIETLQGETRTLGELEGAFVFLNFWATWCPPCREEMPAMDAMYAELAGPDFEILAVSVQESPATVRDYVQSEGYSFPVLLDESGQVASRYGIRGLPTTFFIAPTGRVLGMLMGIRTWDNPRELEAMRELAALSARIPAGGDGNGN